MKRFRFFLLLLPLILITGVTSAQKMFLKISGVEGESTDRDHRDWINLLSFNQSVSSTAGSTGAVRMMVGKADFNDFTLKKEMDKSSPLLMQKCATGEMIPEVELVMTGPDGRTVYRIVLTDVRITGVKSSTECNPECRAMEEVAFNYSKITWEYTNSSGGKVKTGYDLKLNKKI
jgi:type VI secretion system secreted protein Hcp